jgi:Ca2+-binding RTX toxin-like protein
VRSGCAPVGLESLEARQLLAAGSLSGSTLVINGGKHWDVISVSRYGKTGLLVDVNGETAVFTAAKVKKLKISGARGDDLISVGSTDRPLSIPAVITGGDGNDTIWSGHGADVLNGDAGDDLIQAQGGNDTVKGGIGDDSLLAGDGDDKVYGEAGDDLCAGGAGNDRVEGGVGDDELHDGWGKDVVYGGAGADTFFVMESRKEFPDMSRYEARETETNGYTVDLGDDA